MKAGHLSTFFYLSFLGMELTYLYLLASLLNGPIYILILMLLLYPFALLSKLALPQSAFSNRLRFALEMALVTLVILLVAGERLFNSLASGQADIPDIILRIGFCGLSWFMGHTVPHEGASYPTISFRLQIGILAILVFSQFADRASPVFLFFALASLALFLARWASSFSRGATALISPNLRHLLLAGATLIVPGIALIILFSPTFAHAIVDWLKNIFMRLSGWLDIQLPPSSSTPSFNFNFSCTCMQPEPLPPSTPTPPPVNGTINPAVIWVIVFFIFLAVVTLIAFTLRKWKAKRKAQQVEPVQLQIRMVPLNMLHSLIFLFPRLFKKLWFWLTLLFRKWRKRTRPSEEALTSLRALYRNLLRWAARQGVTRLPSQTPLEHMALMAKRFYQREDDLRQVTEAYLLARYSQRSLSQKEFDRARKAWHRLVTNYT